MEYDKFCTERIKNNIDLDFDNNNVPRVCKQQIPMCLWDSLPEEVQAHIKEYPPFYPVTAQNPPRGERISRAMEAVRDGNEFHWGDLSDDELQELRDIEEDF